jgi:hypothetical protein
MPLSIWNSIIRSLFSTQLTRKILRNISKKFSPTWRSCNKFTLLVTSSKTQLIRSIIIPRWRTAHCFWLKYFENQARYENVVNGLHMYIFDDATSRVNLLKLLHGLNFFEKFLKILRVNWVLKRRQKIEFHIDNDMWFARWKFRFLPYLWRMHIECISKTAECKLLLIKISRFISKTKQDTE